MAGRASAYGVPQDLVTAWSSLLQAAVSHLCIQPFECLWTSCRIRAKAIWVLVVVDAHLGLAFGASLPILFALRRMIWVLPCVTEVVSAHQGSCSPWRPGYTASPSLPCS